jgi:uncharacterized membrane protein
VAAYWLEWLNFLARWVHLITGVAWIGASFHFIWLDCHLRPAPAADDTRPTGEVWSVHGGGFYHARKYAVPPGGLPVPLHWFKWEAYSTWLSGMFLMVLIYYLGAEVYLIDPAVRAWSAGSAITAGLGFVAGGWIVYDQLCKSPLGSRAPVLAAVLVLALAGAAWALGQLFSGRGAFIHFGALLGTIMVGNVFFVIMPAQRAMVATIRAGRAVDPSPGERARQRSTHNTYFTLPVLMVMIGSHYAVLTSHRYNWLILIGLSIAGALIRLFFVFRNQGRRRFGLLIAGVAGITLVAIGAAPWQRPAAAGKVDPAQVMAIMTERCAGCHAARPTEAGWHAPPKGIRLDSPDAVVRNAPAIYQQSVLTRAMPIANLTRMTETERAVVGAWFRAGAPLPATRRP